jgi:hypothetical protein
VHVQAHQLEPMRIDAPQRIGQLLVPDPMLARLAARVRLTTVPVSEAGIDAQPHAMSRMPRPELIQHVGRARVHRNVELDHARQRGCIQQIGRVHHLRGIGAQIEARDSRPLDLAERHRIDARALGTQKPQNVHVRARLLRIPDHIERTQLSHPLADRRRIVHIAGRSIGLRDPLQDSRALGRQRIHAGGRLAHHGRRRPRDKRGQT